MSKLIKKLQNPYLLVGQGFILGAVMFFASHDDLPRAAAAAPAAETGFIDRLVARL